MAMPMDFDGMRTDDASLRTDNVDDYKRTCMDFIEDISHDYEAWVIITNCLKMKINEDVQEFVPQLREPITG